MRTVYGKREIYPNFEKFHVKSATAYTSKNNSIFKQDEIFTMCATFKILTTIAGLTLEDIWLKS